jgi:hypothetical protein
MVRAYTDKELLQRVKELDSFKDIPSGYWLLGVRSSEDEPNRFDDKIYLFKGEQFVDVTSCTTNPGTTVLRNYSKFNAKGAAVVVADQWYYGVWRKGKHQGKITALIQIGAQIKVWRDGDKDDASEESLIQQAGFFGINFHPNTYDINAKSTGSLVNGWSAGCQVVNNMEKYRKFINLVPANTSITYCLLNEF